MVDGTQKRGSLMGYEIFICAGKRSEMRWDYMRGRRGILRFVVFSLEQGGAVS
jgi:hypothetical protein